MNRADMNTAARNGYALLTDYLEGVEQATHSCTLPESTSDRRLNALCGFRDASLAALDAYLNTLALDINVED